MAAAPAALPAGPTRNYACTSLRPQVRNVPVWLLKGTRGLLRSFQWATDAADRLAFAEVLSSNESFSADMGETYKLLGVDPASITTLDAYLKVSLCALLCACARVCVRGCMCVRVCVFEQGRAGGPASQPGAQSELQAVAAAC